MTESRDHAVVMGGSLAGLLTARVLTDHFSRVTLVERDQFPDGAAFRPGVPQGRHLHVLWRRGLKIAEHLFPGLEQELRTAGAPDLGIPSDMLWLTPEGWRRRFESTRLLTFSRGLLDWRLRTRLEKNDRLRMLTGHEVTGLVPDSTGAGVAGVELRQRGSGAPADPLSADLVVDATGRGSRTPEWLGRLGLPEPPQTRVDSLLGYASRYYAIPEGYDPGWKALYLQAAPPGSKRNGLLFPQEDGRWIVSLSGAGGDYAPTGEKEFLDFAASLRSPVLHDAIRQAEPLSPITSQRNTANHRRHYERLPRWPRGLAVIGDAVCAFNPVYGQGMSVAAISALTLGACLSAGGGPDVMGRRFQRLAAKDASGAWLVATGEDFRYTETQGPPVTLRTRLVNRYVARVVAVANVDERMCRRMIDVLSLTAGPESLFRPDVLWRAAVNRTPQPSGPDGLTV